MITNAHLITAAVADPLDCEQVVERMRDFRLTDPYRAAVIEWGFLRNALFLIAERSDETTARLARRVLWITEGGGPETVPRVIENGDPTTP